MILLDPSNSGWNTAHYYALIPLSSFVSLLLFCTICQYLFHISSKITPIYFFLLGAVKGSVLLYEAAKKKKVLVQDETYEAPSSLRLHVAKKFTKLDSVIIYL